MKYRNIIWLHQDMGYQKTLLRNVYCKGIGIHTGKEINLTIKPGAKNSGFNFIRVDLDDNNTIPGRFNYVSDTKLCTVIENYHGVKIGTVEHLMAAFWGLGIDNAIIEVDGPEIPVMDGSSAPFIALIEKAGTINQKAPQKTLKITEEIIFQDGDKYLKLSPSDNLELNVKIDFDHPLIGRQEYIYDNNKNNFNYDISRARTYGYTKDVEKLRSLGLAQGASLDNAIGLDDTKILNPEGLRFTDEFVRHKTLDLIGDLYLAGYNLIAKVEAFKPSHALNNSILRKLFSMPHTFKIIEEIVILNRVAVSS